MEQLAKDLTQHEQGHGHRSGCDEHLAHDQALRGRVEPVGQFQEWDQGDFGADADQEEQEEIGDELDVDRGDVHGAATILRPRGAGLVRKR
jgi:hypothetical protein